MFRRRRIQQGNPLSADQMASLVKANQLVAQGRPLEAAPLFVGAADAMQSSGHPRRAANLYARAAHAFVDGNNAQAALVNAKEAMTLFSQSNMPARFVTFYTHITRKMESHGMQATVDQLQQQFAGQVTALPAISHQTHGLLPTACPKCGAPIYSDELTWVDENTLECDYCGTMIRSE